MPKPKRTALLDLDGTLIDSAPDLAAAAADWLVDMGRPALDRATVVGFIGDGAAQLVRRCLAATGGETGIDMPAATAAYLATYADRRNRDSHPYPGVEEALDALLADGWALAVVTNKPEGPASGLLADTGLAERFTAVVGGDTLSARKPDPAPLLEACRRLDRSARSAVMVGDGPQDAAAAKAAGIPNIHVTFGYGDGPAVRAGADAVACDWPQVLAALRDLADG